MVDSSDWPYCLFLAPAYIIPWLLVRPFERTGFCLLIWNTINKEDMDMLFEVVLSSHNKKMAVLDDMRAIAVTLKTLTNWFRRVGTLLL